MHVHPLDAFLAQIGWRRFTENDMTTNPTRVRLICYEPQPTSNMPQLVTADVTLRRQDQDVVVGVRSQNLYPFLQTLIARSGALCTVSTTFGIRPCSCQTINGTDQWSPLCIPLYYIPAMDDRITFAWVADIFRRFVTHDGSWQCANSAHLIGL